MIGLSVPLIRAFGLYGFLCLWLASEVTQMVLIYLENRKLFDHHASITFTPVIKLALVMLVSLPGCMGLVHFAVHRSIGLMAAIAVVGVATLIAESYFVFGLKGVWIELEKKMRQSVRPA